MALRWVLVLGIIFSWPLSVNTSPTVAFPFNSQVPPVARIGQYYSFTFSSSTFSSTLPLSYTLSAAPSWLSMNSDTRTLTGTPALQDVGSDALTDVAFGLTATDPTGSTTLTATLVVSKVSGPAINVPISAQLQAFGAYSAPSTILYHPSTSFQFTFDPNTFSSAVGSVALSYYAVSRDNSPLPAWIAFDAGTLTFSGETPDVLSLVQPPQIFGVNLLASDVKGFSAASVSFSIKVGAHVLAFESPILLLNASAGAMITYNGLSGTLLLDGEVPKSSDIASITAQTPSWMTFDNASLAFSGLVPKGASSVNITVEAKDIYGNVADANVRLTIIAADKIFKASVPSLNATIGSAFSFDLGTYLQNEADVNMTLQPSSPESWLNFDNQSFKLSGKVPSTMQPVILQIKLIATSISQGTSETQAFTFAAMSETSSVVTGLPTQTPASPTPSPTIVTTSQVPSSNTSNPHSLSTGIWLAILLPVGFVCLLSLTGLVYLCCRRRAAKKYRAPPEKGQISAPVPEYTSSIEIVVTPPRISPPQPLELNMSGFTHHRFSTGRGTIQPVNNEGLSNKKPNGTNREALTRSITSVNWSEEAAALARLRELGTTPGDKRLTRSFSDNALSNIESSWRSTEESAGTIRESLRSLSHRSPKRSQSHKTPGSSLQYSNYSRKGHRRSSARVVSLQFLDDSGPMITRTGSTPQDAENTFVDFKNAEISAKAPNSFSVLHTASRLRPTSESIYEEDHHHAPSIKRNSRIVPMHDAPLILAMGHGRRSSISSPRESFTSSIFGRAKKRRSDNFGDDWEFPREIKRESKTWHTVSSNNPYREDRESVVSDTSDYEDSKPRNFSPRKSTIRQVMNSPSLQPSFSSRSGSSEISKLSRPISRRIGSSPFFANVSKDSKRSFKSTQKIRRSYADSPTVPEEGPMATHFTNFEDTIMQGTVQDHESSPRDSFGISYGAAREGTRQLRSYIQSTFQRPRTGRSSHSSLSRDSRFESAEASSVSLPQPGPQMQNENAGYEDYLHDTYSEGSWETAPRTVRESTADEVVEAVRAAVGRQDARGSEDSVGIGHNAKIFRGAGRRPESVEAKRQESQKASRGLVETDYTAYI